MPKSLLDTDIFSEILKGVDQVVVQRATDYRAVFGRYTISAITVMEVVKGLHKVSREDRIQQFLALWDLPWKTSVLSPRFTPSQRHVRKSIHHGSTPKMGRTPLGLPDADEPGSVPREILKSRKSDN